MKLMTSLFLLLNLTPAWAHAGHSGNAFIFAFVAATAILLAKPTFKLVKVIIKR